MAVNPAVNDPEVLETLYWHEGLSMWQIAQRLDVSETTVYRRMRKFGIDRRGRSHYSQSQQTKQYAKYARYRVNDGYTVWEGNGDSDGFATTFVHQLLLVAEGEDPHEVYSDEYHCHHDNGVRWDNRPENLELLTAEEHMELHAERGDLGGKMLVPNNWYTEEEMLEWLNSFVEHFGFVPKAGDLRGWPGPSPRTYDLRFGSFTNALKDAGYTPRSEQ